MAATGGGISLMNAKDAAKLAEVDAMRRDADIAERLAALRAARSAAATGAGAGKRPAKRAKAR